jgi:integrase
MPPKAKAANAQPAPAQAAPLLGHKYPAPAFALPFVCSPQAHRRGLAIRRHAIRRRFLTACRALGSKTLTIHHGRHTFVSHTLAGGRTLAEVRDAAGHRNVAVTSAFTCGGGELYSCR